MPFARYWLQVVQKIQSTVTIAIENIIQICASLNNKVVAMKKIYKLNLKPVLLPKHKNNSMHSLIPFFQTI